MALTARLKANACLGPIPFPYRDLRFLWGYTLLHSLGMAMEQVALRWLSWR